MANRTLLAFRRRHNEDGTWDSILKASIHRRALATPAVCGGLCQHQYGS